MPVWAAAIVRLIADLISNWLSRLERDRQNREAGRTDERERQLREAEDARDKMGRVPICRPDDVVQDMRDKGLF